MSVLNGGLNETWQVQSNGSFFASVFSAKGAMFTVSLGSAPGFRPPAKTGQR